MYDDAAVKRILERAIELDAARSTSMTRHEILQVARELGISDAAVGRAIDEITLPTVPPKHVSPAPVRPLKILALTTVLGGISSLITGGGIAVYLVGGSLPFAYVATLLVPGALIMLSGALAVSSGVNKLRAYLERNVAVWLGAAFGATVTMEAFASSLGIGTSLDSLLSYGTGMVVTSVIGTCIISFRARSESADADSPTSGGTDGAAPSLRVRALRFVKRWLDRIATVPPVLRAFTPSRHGAESASMTGRSAF